MTARKLTNAELQQASALLTQVRAALAHHANGDAELLFALRRKVYKELTYDERSKPMVRRQLKLRKHIEQQGKCAICTKPLPLAYSELDRKHAPAGYTPQNTRLVHAACHQAAQKERNYT